MVNIDDQLSEIKIMIDRGDYFVINRAKFYGKTTILHRLSDYISNEYEVFLIDFQKFNKNCFSSNKSFSKEFLHQMMLHSFKDQSVQKVFQEQIENIASETEFSISILFNTLSNFCKNSSKPIVILIDEIDHASNYDTFVDFLSQIRAYYNQRFSIATFQSVILIGVYDVESIKRRLAPANNSRFDCPWNIAADFEVDLSLQPRCIADMLEEYKKDYSLTFDQKYFADQIYAYTSGYPYLVSKICEIIDTQIATDLEFNSKENAWTQNGFLKAINILLLEEKILLGSLSDMLKKFNPLKEILSNILLRGETVEYNSDNDSQKDATRHGFFKVQNLSNLIVSNRVFEIYLYNKLLKSSESIATEEYKYGNKHKLEFITNGHLNMELVLQKFVEFFHDLYGDQTKDLSIDPQNYKFMEEEGRKRFLLFLRPIINDVGNYYIEAHTRDQKRIDLIVDYLGKRYIIELKILHGDSYNERGDEQLINYLDYFHQTEGYKLSFDFNKNKKIGINYITLGKYKIIEAIV